MNQAVQSASAPLSPTEVRRGLRISMIEGTVAQIYISITGAVGGSAFLTGFALLLGADNFMLGVLGALPFVGQICGYIGAYLEQRLRNRRLITLVGALLGRSIWAPLVVLPFLPLDEGWRLALFLIGLALVYALNGVAGNAWLSWMSDLVPARERGRYFGLRNTLIGVSTMAALYVGGEIMDAFNARDAAAYGYISVFGVAVAAAVGSALLITRQPEPPVQARATHGLAQLIGGSLQDRRYRQFVLTAAVWALLVGVAGSFLHVYGLRVLGLDFATLSMVSIVTAAFGLFFSPLVGWLMDRYGYRWVMTICIIGTIPLPSGWIFSTPDNLWPLWLTAVFSGVFWPGVQQGLNNLMMERSPADLRGSAIATYSLFTGGGTLLSSLIGGVLATIFAGLSVTYAGFHLDYFAVLVGVTTLGRIVMVYFYWRML
jgi:MFS family permease